MLAKFLLAIVGVALLLYLTAAGFLFLRQRQFIYPAPQAQPALAEFPGFRELPLHTSDGLTLRAIHKPARAGLPTILFFHGNGDSLSGAYAATSQLAGAGYGVLLPEYRGYGDNPGSPDEQGLAQDAEAALSALAAQGVPADKVIAVGNSLGSGVATELASRHQLAGLAIVSGFTSLPDVAAEHFRLFPARLLVRDRFDNASKLPHIAAPILVLHGDRDTLIPHRIGTALARASSRAEFHLVGGAGHELAYQPVSQRLIRDWLERIARPAS